MDKIYPLQAQSKLLHRDHIHKNTIYVISVIRIYFQLFHTINAITTKSTKKKTQSTKT